MYGQRLHFPQPIHSDHCFATLLGGNMLNLIVKPKDSVEVPIVHPGTGESLGTLLIAGPDHEATAQGRRALQEAQQARNYKQDYESEVRDAFIARTIGWSGVKDETGAELPFSATLLPEVYSQQWLCSQVLDAINGNEVFFKS